MNCCRLMLWRHMLGLWQRSKSSSSWFISGQIEGVLPAQNGTISTDTDNVANVWSNPYTCNLTTVANPNVCDITLIIAPDLVEDSVCVCVCKCCVYVWCVCKW